MAPSKKNSFRYNVNNQEKIKKLYLDEKKSTKEIARELNISRGSVTFILKMLKIERRSSREGLHLYHKNHKNEWLKARSHLVGSKATYWKGGRSKNHDGYVLVYCPDHPNKKRSDKYILEHILIWEKTHGQLLPEGYVVHHLNGIKDDNRSENLIAMPTKRNIKLGNPMISELKKRIRELEEENKTLRSNNASSLIVKEEGLWN